MFVMTKSSAMGDKTVGEGEMSYEIAFKYVF